MNVAVRNVIAGKFLAVHMNSFRARAFDPGKAGWKLTADGKSVELKDGNPVWINADNTETTLAGDTIGRLNGEAKGHRERAERAEAALIPFKDIDPAAAKKAIDTVKKLGDKALIEAGEVDKVRAEITGQFTTQIDELKKVNGSLTGDLNNLRVNNVFSQSDFVRDNIAIPRDMFEAYFRNNFKVAENGEVQAFDKSGNRVFSKTKMGEHADPGEALQILVDQHPQKSVILKANNNSGGGNNGGGGNRPGGRTINRVDFDKLSATEQAHTAAEAGKGTVSIID